MVASQEACVLCREAGLPPQPANRRPVLLRGLLGMRGSWEAGEPANGRVRLVEGRNGLLRGSLPTAPPERLAGPGGSLPGTSVCWEAGEPVGRPVRLLGGRNGETASCEAGESGGRRARTGAVRCDLMRSRAVSCDLMRSRAIPHGNE